MATALQIYQRHVRKKLGLDSYAIWPPGRQLQLGDVVTLHSGGELRKRTDLGRLKMDMVVESGRPQPLSATSGHVREGHVQAGARAKSVASATLNLFFKDKGSAVFEVRGFQHRQIGNLDDIRRSVLERYRSDTWETSWCLVDQIWWVETGTIIVSESDEAAVAIAAKSEVPQLKTLADPLEVTVEVQSGGVAKVVCGRDFAAMFTAMKLNFWKSDLRPISTPTGEGTEDEGPELVRLSLDDVERAWRTPDADS